MQSSSPNAPSWSENPLPALLKLAWPIVVSMLSVSTMTLVDTLFVSRLGPAAVAAVGLGGVLTFGLWCFPMGTVRAVKILVSQAVGAGRRSDSHPYLGAALTVGFTLGLVVLLIGVVTSPWLSSLTATPESGAFASSYLAIRSLSSPIFICLIAVEETRQGYGDSRSVMYTTLLGNAINIALDYVFIFDLDLGVAGAAWASNIALSVELVALSVLHHYRDGLRLRGFRREHVRKLLELGVPSGIQFGLEVGSFSVMVIILSAFSETHTAAHQIAVQVLHFAFLPAVAFGEAGSVLVGQAIGAGHSALVTVVAQLTLRVALVYAGLCGLVLFFGGHAIAGAFTSDPTLATIAIHLFTILAFFQVVDAANIVARSVLRGAGDVRFVAVVGIVAAWVCTPTLTYWLGYHTGWGAYGAWVGLSLEVLVATGLLWQRLQSRDWSQVAAVAEPTRAAA